MTTFSQIQVQRKATPLTMSDCKPQPCRVLFCDCRKDGTTHELRAGVGYVCTECGYVLRYFVNVSEPGKAM